MASLQNSQIAEEDGLDLMIKIFYYIECVDLNNKTLDC